MTPDILVAYVPYERTESGHLIRPGLLAVEIVSPRQEGLFRKAERYGKWGVEHVWIINPQSGEAFEFHGGNHFILAKDFLRAGDAEIAVPEVFASLN